MPKLGVLENEPPYYLLYLGAKLGVISSNTSTTPSTTFEETFRFYLHFLFYFTDNL